MDGQTKPVATERPFWLPIAAIRVMTFKVPVSYRFVGVLQADLQALLSDPGLALVAIAFIEVRQVGVLEHSVFIAHYRRSLDQFDFFRHDFVLAAITAVQ
ncbi:hypothetical protein D3C77_221420 [compost metagenome]